MAYNPKNTTIAADVPTELAEAFDKQRSERNQVKKGCMTAALKLWIELRPEIQTELLNQTLSESAFLGFVEAIAEAYAKWLKRNPPK